MSLRKVRRGSAKDDLSRRQIRSYSASSGAFGRRCELLLLYAHRRREERFIQDARTGGNSRPAVRFSHDVNHERDPQGHTDRFLRRLPPASVIAGGSAPAQFVRETPECRVALPLRHRTCRTLFWHPCYPSQFRALVLLPNRAAITASATQCPPKLRAIRLVPKMAAAPNSHSHNHFRFRPIHLRSPRTLRGLCRNCATCVPPQR
jgi:hypothetical protein